ncbi:MAG: DNA repair protein RadC [Oscillospiraceae bacterium]|nr:DNA repair protein RadC [Oscillospiraceae bacterium]
MRLKQQFSEHGGESMNDIQFLEMLLYYAIPRSDTNELSHALLERYGSIRGVLDADEADLQKVAGVGKSTVLLFKAAKETMRRYMSSPSQEKAYICSSSDAGRYFVPILRFETEEKVYLMCLNGRGGVISCTQLGTGTFRGVNVSVRRIVDEAVRRHSTSVVLAHNHPSSFAIPSVEDRSFTLELRRALELMDIRLMDHIIVAEGDYVSFAQSGYL